MIKFLCTTGKQSFTWFGQCPRVTITDPELVREVLSDKCGHIEKTKLGQAGRMTAEELANYKKEKWAKERRILNPAFHVENLKVTYVHKISIYILWSCIWLFFLLI